MMVHSDNRGAVDLINGWSVGGGTKHMDCRIMYLRELKEKGIIRVQWILIPQAVCPCIYIIFLRGNKSYYPSEIHYYPLKVKRL